MATGDMKARLLLDSKDFEKNIKKSKRSVDDFSKSGKGLGASFIPQLKAIAVAMGAIKVAEKAFKAAINSSQTLGDSFRAEVQAMNTVVDNFVYAIANADFSSFSSGLDGIIRRAREAYAAYDQLGNTMLAVNYVQATKGAEYREAMSRARNKDLSIDERMSAIADAEAAGAKVQEAARVAERNAIDALAKGLAAKTGLDAEMIDAEMLDKFFSLDAEETFEEQRKRLEVEYAGYLDKIEAIKEKYPMFWENFFGAGSGKKGKNERAREAGYSALMEEYKDIIVGYELLFREADEDLAKLYNTARSATAAKNQAAEITTSINEVKASTTAAGEKIAEEMANAAAATAKLAGEMRQLKAVRGLGGMAGIGYTDTSLKLPGQIGMLEENPAAKALNYWEGKYLKPFEEDAKRLEDINGVVGMLGSSFSQLGSSIGGAAGNMLTFVGGALDAAQAIIPLIAQIMAEQAAHKANANAALSDAAAKTVSAYAGIPFAGVALGVAGVAAIIGAMQNIPKFAEGGIVNSATLGVFGEAGPEAVMPLDKLDDYIQPREMRVTGNIKASGKELVVVLDNYNRVRNG